MKQRTEEVLFQEWKRGDCEAFGELFGHYSCRSYNLGLRLTGNVEDAQDLLQETALKAFRTQNPCQSESTFYGWVRKILMNLFLDRTRYCNRSGRNRVDSQVDWTEIAEQCPSEAFPSPRAILEEQDDIAAIERALLELPEPYRTVLVLKEIEGLSYDEMARILQVPTETIRTRLRRARTGLRNRLTHCRHPSELI